MSPRDDTVTLRQILEHGRRAVELARTKTRADLDDDWITTFALEKSLEVLGEAVRRLSEDVRGQHPGIPWARIIGLRNELIHGYDKIDLDRLWTILRVDLPDLLVLIEAIIKEGRS